MFPSEKMCGRNFNISPQIYVELNKKKVLETESLNYTRGVKSKSENTVSLFVNQVNSETFFVL